MKMREPGEETLKRTYELPAGLVVRLQHAALDLDVAPTDLVRFLLARGLQAIAEGSLQVPRRRVCWHVITDDGDGKEADDTGAGEPFKSR